MKILAINCNPDLSYFEKRGLPIEVECVNLNKIFPLRFLYNVKDSNNNLVPLYTPDVNAYLEETYKDFKYSFIMVGWKPKDYSPVLKNTGGYTHWQPLTSGTYWITIRQDPFPNNNYPVHELHHGLINIINNNKVLKHHVIDYMDSTPVNGVMMPYYLNDQPDNPNSNYAVTWNQIKNFLPELLAITYDTKPALPLVPLKRNWDNGVQTLGDLTYDTFSCKTLERPFKDNKPNISCIPKGTYLCKWTWSLRLMRYTYEVMNVPNRTGIRFHKGNYFFDVDGCILLGTGYGDLNHDAFADIINSSITIDKFNNLMNKKDFMLQIV